MRPPIVDLLLPGRSRLEKEMNKRKLDWIVHALYTFHSPITRNNHKGRRSRTSEAKFNRILLHWCNSNFQDRNYTKNRILKPYSILSISPAWIDGVTYFFGNVPPGLWYLSTYVRYKRKLATSSLMMAIIVKSHQTRNCERQWCRE